MYYIVRFILEESKQDRFTTRANSMAFSFFLSIFPAVIFAFTLLAYIDVANSFENNINATLSGLLPYNASQYLINMIQDITSIKRSGLLSLGFLFAFYFSSNGILTMMIGFDKSHLEGFGKRTYIEMRMISIMLTIVLFVLLVSSGILIVLGDLVSGYIDKIMPISFISTLFSSLIRWLLAFFLVYSAITIIFKYAPSQHSRVRFWNVGSIVSTVLSLLTSLSFAFFINNFGNYNEIYGSIGALIVVLLWLKINAMILLIGFELNASIVGNKARIDSEKLFLNF